MIIVMLAVLVWWGFVLGTGAFFDSLVPVVMEVQENNRRRHG